MLNRSKQDRYRVYTNSNTTYKSYGTSLGIRYNFLKNYNINANVSYNDLASSNNNSDLFITAFNTPKWSANVSFGNREIVKMLGSQWWPDGRINFYGKALWLQEKFRPSIQ